MSNDVLVRDAFASFHLLPTEEHGSTKPSLLLEIAAQHFLSKLVRRAPGRSGKLAQQSFLVGC